MGQTFDTNPYSATDEVDATLSSMETNFNSLRSSFSGTTSPSAVAGQSFFNTTKKSIQFHTGTQFQGCVYGTTALKVWIYANSAGDGMVVYSSVTDKVLAIKGGSYYTAGGALGGSWNWGHTHGGGSLYVTTTLPEGGWPTASGQGAYRCTASVPDYNSHINARDLNSQTASGSTATGYSTSWRPYAAVGTMQYPNI